MNQSSKEALMNAVANGTLRTIQKAFDEHDLVFDGSYVDYELLQVAFHRRHRAILNFLINTIDCRAGNPNKVKLEKTPLHLAMDLNRESIIEKLLNKGALIFDKDENGEIPLLTGFKNKNYKAVDAILTHCKPICKPDNKDAILHFHIACITNHTDGAKHYLKCGINPNDPINLDFEKYSGLNPVQFAVEKNYFLLFKWLLYYGGDLSNKNAKGLTPLHIIYYNSSTEKIKRRIKSAFERGNHTKFINSEDSNSVSHFHLCCMLNEPDFVQTFIDNGVNINSSISSDCTINPGFTPLHFAVTNGCKEVVELLLKSGADCNKKDKEGKTPLHLACKLSSGNRKEYIFKMLLDYKANPAITDKQGCTPLHVEFYYVQSENKNCIFDMLLSKISEKINYTNDEGLSYFHIVCTTNNVSQVKDFLDSGVNVDSCISSGMYSGYTALHFAVLHNQKDVVKLLLEKNAQVNIKTTEFQVTPLHLACEFNYAKFRGLNPNQKSENVESFPINLDSTSNRTNQLDIINLLLLNGAYVDTKDYQGITPLLQTCMIDRNFCKLKWSCLSYSTSQENLNKEINTRINEIIKMLFSEKAQVNVCSSRQESILHILSKYSFLVITEELIELIVSKCADIDAVDDAGLTPLHVAAEANNKRMVRFLLKHEAMVNIKCKKSKIPLHCFYSTYNANRRKFGVKFEDREIFCALLESGSDVNIIAESKKEKNMILLHDAIEIGEDFIIEQFLNYGADINLEDSLGNSCISELFNWRNEDSDPWLEYDLARVFQIVYVHVQKLLALGLHVSKKVLKHCSQLYPHHRAVVLDETEGYYNLDNIFYDCINELERMKIINIDNHTSLYSILMKDPHELSKHVRNEILINIIQAQNLNEDFPLYSNLLKVQFTRGSMRSSFLQAACTSLRNVTNIYLPDLCCDAIFVNLTNNDLANLKKVAPTKNLLKRKLIDSNLKEIEPLPSCKKARKIDD